MKFLKWLAALLLACGLGLAAFLYGMGFHDGPLGPFPGGPFKEGERAPSPADWSFLAEHREIELQILEPSSSRLVWVAVFKGQAYIVSGFMTTFYGRLWKQWPHDLAADDRVILRVDGKLYEQRLERLLNHEQMERLLGHRQMDEVMTVFAKKYGFQLPEDPANVVRSGSSWLYAVLERKPEGARSQ